MYKEQQWTKRGGQACYHEDKLPELELTCQITICIGPVHPQREKSSWRLEVGTILNNGRGFKTNLSYDALVLLKTLIYLHSSWFSGIADNGWDMQTVIEANL